MLSSLAWNFRSRNSKEPRPDKIKLLLVKQLFSFRAYSRPSDSWDRIGGPRFRLIPDLGFILI
jgi:hypothetical protein